MNEPTLAISAVPFSAHALIERVSDASRMPRAVNIVGGPQNVASVYILVGSYMVKNTGSVPISVQARIVAFSDGAPATRVAGSLGSAFTVKADGIGMNGAGPVDLVVSSAFFAKGNITAQLELVDAQGATRLTSSRTSVLAVVLDGTAVLAFTQNPTWYVSPIL